MDDARKMLDPEELRRLLEGGGWRFTPQRWEVYDYLHQRKDAHLTAEEVFQGVRDRLPSISLATIYKALEALEAVGLVAKLADGGEGSARFDARTDRHYHLRCMRTGRVEDVPTAYDPDLLLKLDPDLAEHLKQRGFRLTGYRLELLGAFEEPAPVE